MVLTVQTIVDNTPWWLLVVPAAAGLLGALIVAVFQDRSSDRKWRKDARLRSYSDFIKCVIQFDSIVDDLLLCASATNTTPEYRNLMDQTNRVSAAGISVMMVGPERVTPSVHAISECVSTVYKHLAEDSNRQTAVRTQKLGIEPDFETKITAFEKLAMNVLKARR
jgi:hypothetical protein